MGERAEYVVVNNAGHFSFLSPFPGEAKKSLRAVADDPEGFDRKGFHAQMNQEILDFLVRSLPLATQ